VIEETKPYQLSTTSIVSNFLLFLNLPVKIKKMFKLTRSKSKALSTICANFSEVFLASFIIPILKKFDISEWPVLALGLVTTIISVLLSLIFAEKGKL